MAIHDDASNIKFDPRDFVCISMSAVNRHGFYRFSGGGGTVFYVEAYPNAPLKDDEYGFPPAILMLLPPRPASCNWVDIKDAGGTEWRARTLKGVQNCWHPRRIDLRDLRPIKYFNPNVCQVVYQTELAIAKIARFDFEVPFIEQETFAYRIIEGKGIGPRFLGHLMEHERVIGILLEYVPARPGTPADFDVCLDVLRKLHDLKIVLKDINKHNFLVDGARALICDFADCLANADDETLKVEEDALMENLADDFGDDDDNWSDFGQQRLKEMSNNEYRI